MSRLGKYKLFLNNPLDKWSHGGAADPHKWPWWKMFHFAHNDLPAVHPPSSGHRYWLYTRRKAYDMDIYVDRRSSEELKTNVES